MMFWSLHLPRPFAPRFLGAPMGDLVSGLGREHVLDGQDMEIRSTTRLHRLTRRLDSLSPGKGVNSEQSPADTLRRRWLRELSRAPA